jgi:hypothetical protein
VIRLADRYRLEEVIGAGGTATVYRAIDEVLGVARAVKLLNVGAGPGMVDRLRAEARALARVAHPNVLGVYDIVHADGRDFIVMELVSGGSLQDHLDAHGPYPVERACALCLQVVGALEAAHAVGVIHRDVKPQNVLLDDDGNALLADFGIARVGEDARATRTNVAMGSLAYMAPEQRLDARGIGVTADVYALGSTLYALLTAASPMDLFAAPRRSPRWSDIPAPLQPLLQRATRHDPEERQPDMAHFRAELLAAIAVLDGPSPEVAATDPAHEDRRTPWERPPHVEAEPDERSGEGPPKPVLIGSATDVTLVDVQGGELVDIQHKRVISPEAVPERTGEPRDPAPRRAVALALVGALGVVLVVAFVWWGGSPLPAVEEAPRASAEPPSAGVAPDAEGAAEAFAGGPAGTEAGPPNAAVVVAGDRRAVASGAPAHAPLPTATNTAAPGSVAATARGTRATSAPEQADRPDGVPFARAWTGSFNGRTASLALAGSDPALSGTWTVRFGDTEVTSAVKGRWAGGVLSLEDTEDTPDAGRYTARLGTDGALDGRFEGRANGRTVSFRMRAAEP